ncbi:Tim44-like domain-containing protein [Neisseriaceae bacterium ESL0693]|nr:Tim44-like domain-containing protein [Neisseriaceae bacterium ESL0693]
MQNKPLKLLTTATVIASLMLAPLAEAKRMGGGGNRGMSRSYSGQSYQRQPAYRPQPQPQRTYQPQQQQQPAGNGMGRMIGAGVAGAAIGAVAGHAMANNQHERDNQSNQPLAASAPVTQDQTMQQQPQQQPAKGNFSWLWLIILALGGFFLFRRFKNKGQNAPTGMNFAQQNHSGAQNQNSRSGNTNIFGQSLQGNSQQNTTPLPDGTQPEAFLRFARQRFNHVQSMNNGSNLEEIRRYFTPEMYAEVKQDIAGNQDIAEFSDLNTDLVGSAQENGQYIAGVRFSGLVSEELGSQPVPFSEVWHFVKPAGGQSEWLIAGIQQD